jgi:hypothetical protein
MSTFKITKFNGNQFKNNNKNSEHTLKNKNKDQNKLIHADYKNIYI